MWKKLGYIVLLVLVLGLSEFAYLLKNNKQNLVSAYAIYFAQRAIDKENTQGAIDSLTRASEINMKSVAKKYPDFVPTDYRANIEVPSTPSELTKALSLYIKSLDLSRILQSQEGDMARVVYTLGLLSYKNGGPQLTPGFFQTAIYLNPELSHFHVELANLYLKNGDEKASLATLDYCSKFKFPSTHCKQYLDNNYFWKTPEEIGFLENPIKEHYLDN